VKKAIGTHVSDEFSEKVDHENAGKPFAARFFNLRLSFEGAVLKIQKQM
jgi:hypothetical protein